MYWIERRAHRDLFGYILESKEKYVGLGEHIPSSATYLKAVLSHLPIDWTVNYEKGVWCNVRKPNINLPNTGFKIHVSTEFSNAVETLNIIVPVLVKREITFKFLVDEFSLRYMNSIQCPKSSSGKYLTIYPRDEKEFKQLIAELKPLTAHLTGPYILSDKRIDDSKILFYRYGAFLSKMQLNIYGEFTPLMQLPSKEWTPDRRGNSFFLPDGVTDLYPSKLDVPESITLNEGRFTVSNCLSDSNKGGVYVAIDTTTNQQVIIKEARPYIGSHDLSPYDAVALLENEKKALRKLETTGVTPRLIADFMDWENAFLAIEKLEGIPLSTLRAMESFGLSLQPNLTIEVISSFYRTFLTLAENLLNAVYSVHDSDIIIVDISPQNVLYEEQTQKIFLIDLEGANIEGSSQMNIATTGFGNLASVAKGEADFCHDFQAVSDLLFNLLFPVNELFTINPDAKLPFLRQFTLMFGGSDEITEFIVNLGTDRNQNFELLERAKRSIANINLPQIKKNIEIDRQLVELKQAIIEQVKAVTSTDRAGFSYRADYRTFSTNDYSFIHGVTGILWVLNKVQGSSIGNVEALLIKNLHTPPQLAPGIATGVSGIAWGIWDLGYETLAERLLCSVQDHELLRQNADLLYGSAGWGLTNLYFYHQSDRSQFLDNAVRTEKLVYEQLQIEDDKSYFQYEDGTIFSGFGHGASGIALFYLRLFQATNKPEYLAKGESLLRYEIDNGTEHSDHISWPYSVGSNINTPYLRVGSTGVIQVLLRFYQVTNKSIYLSIAEKGCCGLKNKLTATSGLLNGLSGIGELFIDMYRVTEKDEYLLEAKQYAEKVQLFSLNNNGKVSFPGEENVRFADDWGSGSTGVAWFLHRLESFDKGLFYDF